MRVWAGAIALNLGLGLGLGLISGLPGGGIARAITPEEFEFEGELTAEDATVGASRYVDSYTFEGRAGEMIAIEVDSEVLDSVVMLFHSTGPVSRDRDSGDGNNALLVVELPRDGEYEVLVAAVSQGQVGEYRLRWRTATERDRQQFRAAQLNRQGFVLRRSSQWAEAAERFRAANQLYQIVGDRHGEAQTLNNLGKMLYSQGQFDQALVLFQSALTMREEVGDRQGIGITLNDIALVHSTQGRLDQALQGWKTALAIFRDLGLRAVEGTTLNNIAWVYGTQGQYERALTMHQRVLQIRRAVGDRLGEGATLLNMGSMRRRLGEYAGALSALQEAREIFQALGARGEVAKSLNSLGRLYEAQEEYDRALELYGDALAIHRELGDRYGSGLTLGNMGDTLLKLKNLTAAVEKYEASLAILRQGGNLLDQGATLNNMGLAYAVQGDNARATALFQESLQVAEAVERELPPNDQAWIAFFERRAETYAFLQAALVGQGKVGEALAVADRSRARSLAQLLNGSGESPGDNAITLDEIRQMARDRQATIVSYGIFYQNLYIWVVSPEGRVAFRAVDPDSIGLSFQNVVGQIRRAATNPFDLGGFFAQEQFRLDLRRFRGNGLNWTGGPKDLKRAYELLVQPIEDLLPTGQGDRLIIVPHRELSTMPFVALIDSQDRFLLDRYTITVTPSLQILNLVEQTPQSAKGQPLIIGNPDPMPDKLSPLPGSEKEAQAIAQALNTTALMGKNATETMVKQKLETASLLHFATHGVIAKSDREIEGNWLALAEPSNPNAPGNNDGKLTLTEIFNSKLRAQLAVLSACNTVSGEVTGEGVLGLARAFIKAGVPAVVASLWQVPDQQTQLLMEAFYRELLRGKTYGEALRLAQLEVRSQFTNPRDWAAFMVIGDGDRTLELP